ncbi:BQ5605_C103g13158 [Microbotryum silenes-dioicae]|uniref:BQ5605_C004g02589 protein n=1 Tax=Microbotryum silenes-dioicae TaxID=796604 RepID=A0A2X0PCK4_9BASI|nr:BQ5605_C004g02589 [Microbotryum silenes-dioicae]SGZ10485.1 BQ5605_C103g13158 [Microbotryum silenes-dioicae]
MDDNPWGAPTPTTPSPRPIQSDVNPIRSLRLSVGGGGAENENENENENQNQNENVTISSAGWDATERSTGVVGREQVQQEKERTGMDVEEKVEHVQTGEQVTPTAPTEPETSSTRDRESEPPAHEDGKDSEGYSSPPPAMVRSASNPLVLPPIQEGPPMDDFDDDESGPTPVVPQAADDDEDDFDDFGEAAEAGGDADDAGFGDFGHFGDTHEGDVHGFEGFDEQPPTPSSLPRPEVTPIASSSFAAFQSTGHPPLLLELTNPSKAAIEEQLHDFFEGVYPGARGMVSDEPERQVEGVGQVLASESTRTLLAGLSSLPALKPLDWRRSRIRREHLITLGVPINLDDVRWARHPPFHVVQTNTSLLLQTAPVKQLASLTLPPQRSHSPHTTRSPTSAFAAGGSISRSTTHFADRERARALHQVPILDRKLADSLLALREHDLVGLSLADLQRKVAEMDRVTEEASAALTHALVTRDKESGDAETYNGMIQDLVAAAAKTKTTSAAGGRSSPALRTASGGRWGRSVVK